LQSRQKFVECPYKGSLPMYWVQNFEIEHSSNEVWPSLLGWGSAPTAAK